MRLRKKLRPLSSRRLKKIRYEVKKAVRKLTVKLIVAGVALAGAAVLVSNVGKAGKAVGFLNDKNEK